MDDRPDYDDLCSMVAEVARGLTDPAYSRFANKSDVNRKEFERLVKWAAQVHAEGKQIDVTFP